MKLLTHLWVLVALLLMNCSTPTKQSGNWPGLRPLNTLMNPGQTQVQDWSLTLQDGPAPHFENSQIKPEYGHVNWNRQYAEQGPVSWPSVFVGYGTGLSPSGLGLDIFEGVRKDLPHADFGLSLQAHVFTAFGYKEEGHESEFCIGMGCSGEIKPYRLDRAIGWGVSGESQISFRYWLTPKQALGYGAYTGVSFLGHTRTDQKGQMLSYQYGNWSGGMGHHTLERSLGGEFNQWSVFVNYRNTIQLDSSYWEKIKELQLKKSLAREKGMPLLKSGFWCSGLADFSYGMVDWQRSMDHLQPTDTTLAYQVRDSSNGRLGFAPGLRLGYRIKSGWSLWLEYSKSWGNAYGTENKFTKALPFSEYYIGYGLGQVSEGQLWGIKLLSGNQDWNLYSADLLGFGLEYYKRVYDLGSWRVGLGGGVMKLTSGLDQPVQFQSKDWRLQLGLRLW